MSSQCRLIVVHRVFMIVSLNNTLYHLNIPIGCLNVVHFFGCRARVSCLELFWFDLFYLSYIILCCVRMVLVTRWVLLFELK